MRYEQLSSSDEIVWIDDAGNTGVIRPAHEAEWAAYLAWLAVTGETPLFGALPLPTLAQARHEATQRLHAAVEDVLAPLLSQYAKVEAESWAVQLFEATRWLADQRVPTPLIDPICAGDDKVALCHAIVAKGAAYGHLCGETIAWRRACSAWIEACTSVASLTEWQPQYPEVPHAAD